MSRRPHGGRRGPAARSGGRIALLGLGLAAACAGPARDDPWEAPSPAGDGGVVGWIDERPVSYAEVGRFLRERDPVAFFRHLEGLILERLTRAEAAPLGVTVEPGTLERATRRRLAEWDQRVRAASRRQTGREVEPALWLQRTAGLTMLEFEDQVRRHTEVELLQDRLLRYEQLLAPRAELSMLVTPDAELARTLRARIDQGAEFAALAREHSVHESAADGGRLPFPLLRADIADPAVRESVFSLEPGAVAGPFATEGPQGAAWYQLYRLEARHDAANGPWARLAERVRQELRKRPVDVGEYERWRRRMLMRHGFAAAAGPIGGDG